MCDDNKAAGCCSSGGNTMMGIGCTGHHYRLYKLLKLLIVLLILAFVFSYGVRLGELKGFIKANHGFDKGFMEQGDNGTNPALY